MLAAFATTAFAGAAVAQDRPAIAPTKDVTVEYSFKVTPKGAPVQQGQSKMSTAAGGTRMRIDGFVPGGYMIRDRAGGHTAMVMDTQHMVMEMPFDPARAGPFAMRENLKFARKGTDTVAGVRCTVWETQGDQGSGTACITDDGVMLRGESSGPNGQVQMTPTSVSYAPLADSVFQAPAGCQKMQVPAGAGGATPKKP
jgi:hypothetical protein